jgi:hypothetical protein
VAAQIVAPSDGLLSPARKYWVGRVNPNWILETLFIMEHPIVLDPARISSKTLLMDTSILAAQSHLPEASQ